MPEKAFLQLVRRWGQAYALLLCGKGVGLGLERRWVGGSKSGGKFAKNKTESVVYQYY